MNEILCSMNARTPWQTNMAIELHLFNIPLKINLLLCDEGIYRKTGEGKSKTIIYADQDAASWDVCFGLNNENFFCIFWILKNYRGTPKN